jgi:predicted AAA+ superfamily ATPase
MAAGSFSRCARNRFIVRNLSGFARFLPIVALYHGQALNVSNIAREAGVARTTVAGYLNILEETLLCFRLPAYETKMQVRERKLPKWYWCDPGLVRAIKRSLGALISEETGPLFEGLVAQLLKTYRIIAVFLMKCITGHLPVALKPKLIFCCCEIGSLWLLR